MDVQGPLDEKTGHGEFNNLAGLGLLTSSVMVLNTSTDTQEPTKGLGLTGINRRNDAPGHSN